MTLDLDRITHPLRLAEGSHERGSGKGCAMNVISYVNGDTEITDYPDCSARPLARLVQVVNDDLAGADGYLSAEDAIVVLDLGWKTVGTADVPVEVMLRWLADLLVDPQRGVVQFTEGGPVSARTVRNLAASLLRAAEGESVSTQEWIGPIGAYGAYAYVATNAGRSFFGAAADAEAAAYAAAAAACAAAGVAAGAYVNAAYDAAEAAHSAYSAAAYTDFGRVDFTGWAIQRWRDLAGLDDVPVDSGAVDAALAEIAP